MDPSQRAVSSGPRLAVPGGGITGLSTAFWPTELLPAASAARAAPPGPALPAASTTDAGCGGFVDALAEGAMRHLASGGGGGGRGPRG